MKKKIKIILASLAVILVIFAIPAIVGETNPKKNVLVAKVTSLSMVMVGDCLIHSPVYNDAYVNGTYDFTKMVELIKPLVTPYDVAFYNQETTLGGTELGLSSYPQFNSPYEVGDAMRDAGFDMVSLANNHTIDRGTTAVNNSVAYWNKYPNILTAGSYSSTEDKNTDKIFTINKISYTLLAYTYGTNGLTIPSGKDYLVDVYSNAKAAADIARLRSKVDVLMVSMHWGDEYTHVPTSTQVAQANFLASLGVDIIIGTHPHVIQPITKINDTIVIYSLGNFLSSQIGIERLVGLMASVKITKTVYGKEITIKKEITESELLYTYYSSARNKFKVIPFSQIDKTWLYNYESVYNTYSAIVKKYDNSLIVNPLKNKA